MVKLTRSSSLPNKSIVTKKIYQLVYNQCYVEEFLSENEEIRKLAIERLKERLEASPNDLLEQIPGLLGTIDKSIDPFVSLQIASIVSELFTNNPNVISVNFDQVINTISILADNELANDEDLLTGTTINLLTPLQNSLKLEDNLLKSFPTLIKLMGKQSSIKWSAYSPLANILMTNPVIAIPYAEDLLDVIEHFPQLLMILPNLYTSKPEAFQSKVDTLMKLYKSQPDQQLSIIGIIGDIAGEKQNLIIPYITNILPGLNSPMVSYQVMSILSSIATSDPMEVYPYVEQIKEAVILQPATMIEGANTLSLIARVSDHLATEILPVLFDWLDKANQTSIPLVLAEIRNIAEMNKDLLDPYMDKVRSFLDNPQEAIRDQANLIVNIIEGRDLISLSSQIDEQNAKISEIVNSLDDLRVYFDENLDLLKEFIAEIAKKLPIPVTFSTEGRIRKTLLLHFMCQIQTDRCLYPEDRTFTTETKIINRWLKIAFSTVKLGKAVLIPPSPGDAIKAVKEAYDSYKNNDDQDFLEFIKQPFLTSAEQDSLIEQLKEANFFGVFVYDSSQAGWNCIMCNPKS
ncbi:MAG: hypothetical protein HeimC2_25100 [Candidatus Heimdallarchaeota archaeon LC_2]|nr:MAG: hypothetical protein HeimC2_25100 [Candidatus Heimdallarchaeota archaeon LC_2]